MGIVDVTGVNPLAELANSGNQPLALAKQQASLYNSPASILTMFRHLTSSRFTVVYHPISRKSHIQMAGRSPASGILREISRGNLGLGATNPIVRKTGFKALGSYNWLDKPEPTILVPGMDPHLS